MFQISQAKKDKGIHCCAYACTNEPIARKGGLCHKHYARKRREESLVTVSYNQFRQNAKKRGKEFSVTMIQFKAFCMRTGYLIEKGKRGKNATIDRRCNLHRYHIWNLQLMSNSQNDRKGDRFSGNGFGEPSSRVQTVIEVIEESENNNEEILF